MKHAWTQYDKSRSSGVTTTRFKCDHCKKLKVQQETHVGFGKRRKTFRSNMFFGRKGGVFKTEPECVGSIKSNRLPICGECGCVAYGKDQHASRCSKGSDPTGAKLDRMMQRA